MERFGRDFLSCLKEEDLGRIVTYSFNPEVPRTVPLAELVQHTANHTAHHRAQVMLMLRMLGYAPKDLDMLFYFEERHADSIK